MNFHQEIRRISEEHQLCNYNKFNIFKVMFKQHDEKYLHSRFISFLLDPNGSHKQGTKFLEVFFEVMNISNFSLEGVKVSPNETERGEVHNIDILIRNTVNQAIIVENKFFAKDQTKPDDSSIEKEPLLKYQLTRYYHKLIKEDNKCQVVKMIYLTIDGKDPEGFEKFPDVVKSLIDKKDHLSDIAKWLDLCLSELDLCLSEFNEHSDLERSIQQYKQARFEFLNDVQLALKLKEISGQLENFDEAYSFWNSKTVPDGQELQIIREQFIHIKWHMVHEFYSTLAKGIQEKFGVQVSEINNKHVTKLTHTSKPIPTSLTFEVKGIVYYVCNDESGFSVGRHVELKTENIDFKILFENKYAFFDFANMEVFELMNADKAKELVEKILKELNDFVN